VTMTLTECQSMANWERKQRSEAEAEVARLRAGLQQLFDQMMVFATTRPSSQQTRTKSAREMVETFAYELKDLLAEVVPRPPRQDTKEDKGDTRVAPLNAGADGQDLPQRDNEAK
jgi:hypothetical protein